MRSATIVGYHGRSNLGDDVFLRVAIRFLAAAVPVDRVFVAGFRGRMDAEIEGITVVPYEVEGHPVARFVWLQTFLHALRSRILLFSAGSIFTVLPFFLAYVVVAFLKLARPRMPVVALGVSIGPLRTRFDRFWCGRLVGLFDRVVLRDRASAQLLREINPKVSYEVAHDLALLWLPEIHCRERSRIVGLCIGSQLANPAISEGSSIDACSVLAVAVSALCRELPEVAVRIFVACGDATDGDAAIAEKMNSMLANLGVAAELSVYDGRDPDAFIADISECSAIITSRMHVGVFAMMCGVPTLQIAYARKIGDFYAQCGIGREYLVSPRQLAGDVPGRFLESALMGNLELLAASRQGKLRNCRSELLATVAALEKALAERESA